MTAKQASLASIGLLLVLPGLFLPLFSEAAVLTSVGNLQVDEVVVSRGRARLVLSDPSGPVLTIDCLDERHPSNTFLALDFDLGTAQPHASFVGGNDFYCSGTSAILAKDLRVGDPVGVSLKVETKRGIVAAGSREVVWITDVLFSVPGEAGPRSLAKNPGTTFPFVSDVAIP